MLNYTDIFRGYIDHKDIYQNVNTKKLENGLERLGSRITGYRVSPKMRLC